MAYKGSGPLITDLLGNNIGVAFDNLPGVAAAHPGGPPAGACGGRRRALSVPARCTDDGRSGIEGYALSPWFGVFGPAGMPDAAVQALNRAFVQALAMPDVQAKLTQAGFTPGSSSPDALTELVATEYERLGKVAASARMVAN